MQKAPYPSPFLISGSKTMTFALPLIIFCTTSNISIEGCYDNDFFLPELAHSGDKTIIEMVFVAITLTTQWGVSQDDGNHSIRNQCLNQ